MLSRLWYVVLAFALGVALAAACLAKAVASREAEALTDDHLRRDAIGAELWLKIDARTHIDAVAPLASDADVRSELAEMSAGGSRAATAARKLRARIRALNAQLNEARGFEVLVVDAHGDVVADLRSDASKAQSYGKLPAVASALRGHATDDVWFHKGSLLRIATRPVVLQGQYIGALIHGIPIDEAFLNRLAKSLPGAAVFTFKDSTVIGSSSPAEPVDAQGEAEAIAPSLWATSSDAKQPTLNEGIVVGGSGTHAIAALMTGTAADSNIGYAVIRRSTVSDSSVFVTASKQDVDAMPWAFVIGVPLVLGLLGIAFMFLERDRPLHMLHGSTRRVAEKQAHSIPLDGLRGTHLAVADNINTALRRKGDHTAAESSEHVELTDLLSEYRSAHGNPFAALTPAAIMKIGGIADEIEPKSIVAELPTEPPASAFAVPTVPQALPRKLPLPPATPLAPPPATPPASAPRAQDPASANDDLQLAHYRHVFDDFMRMQQQCGVVTDGLTFDKFRVKLDRTRDAVIAQHAATSVRFSVYVKEGKAALRANPVVDELT